MQTSIIVAIWLVGAYLVGGIPFGFLIGKMRGVDVRTVGSKNIGATNVFRTVGKKWGVLAFACDVLKGLLSHSTMLIGIIYLLVAGLVKIRVKNVISVIVGLMIFFVDGVIINTLYAICELEPCNSMYLLEAPFADMPWLITPVMGLMGVAVAFIITAVYEQIALPKEERWYSLLREKHSQNKDQEALNSK